MKSLTQNAERDGGRYNRVTQTAVRCTELHMPCTHTGNHVNSEMGEPRIEIDTLASMSADRPVLLVCLRHLGCAFSREALADLQAQRAAIEARGARLVLAHLEPPSIAAPLLHRYGLGDVVTVSDPSARVYESCGLNRGSVAQLVGPRVLWRWLTAALVRRHGAGWTGADVRRMPGAFLVERGRIVRAYRHATTADRPDYASLCSP